MVCVRVENAIQTNNLPPAAINTRVIVKQFIINFIHVIVVRIINVIIVQ